MIIFACDGGAITLMQRNAPPDRHDRSTHTSHNRFTQIRVMINGPGASILIKRVTARIIICVFEIDAGKTVGISGTISGSDVGAAYSQRWLCFRWRH